MENGALTCMNKPRPRGKENVFAAIIVLSEAEESNYGAIENPLTSAIAIKSRNRRRPAQ